MLPLSTMSSQESINNESEQSPQHYNNPNAGDDGMNTLYVQCMSPSPAPDGPQPVYDLPEDGEEGDARKSCGNNSPSL